MRFLFEIEAERNRGNGNGQRNNQNNNISRSVLGVGGASIIPQNNNKPKPLFRQNHKK